MVDHVVRYACLALVAAFAWAPTQVEAVVINLEYDVDDIQISPFRGVMKWEFAPVSVAPFSLTGGVVEPVRVNVDIRNGAILVEDFPTIPGRWSSVDFLAEFSAVDGDSAGSSARQLTLPGAGYTSSVGGGAEGNGVLRVGKGIDNGNDDFELAITSLILSNETLLNETTTFDSFQLTGFADAVSVLPPQLLPDDPNDAIWRIGVPAGCVLLDADGSIGCGFDPEIAAGYDYSLSTDEAPNFRSVYLPGALPNGDDTFEVNFDGLSFELIAGELFDFTDFVGGGVSQFSITGIDTSEMLDPTDPTAFVTNLTFANEGNGPFDNPYPEFDLLMAPIRESVSDDPPTTVSEPGTLGLVGVGLLGLAFRKGRRR